MDQQRFASVGKLNAKWAPFTVPMIDYEVSFVKKVKAKSIGMAVFLGFI